VHPQNAEEQDPKDKLTLPPEEGEEEEDKEIQADKTQNETKHGFSFAPKSRRRL
jgi:hypothetical protein